MSKFSRLDLSTESWRFLENRQQFHFVLKAINLWDLRKSDQILPLLNTLLKKEQQHSHYEHDCGTEVGHVGEFKTADQKQQEDVVWLEKLRYEGVQAVWSVRID